jgi:hypothetical protein
LNCHFEVVIKGSFKKSRYLFSLCNKNVAEDIEEKKAERDALRNKTR